MADILVLEANDARAVVDPRRGGRFASVSLDGEELLVGPSSPDDRSIRWGLYLMAPWPGRLANASFRWNDGDVTVSRTHGRHAIHGLVWNRSWDVVSATEREALLECPFPADDWPPGGRVRHRIRLGPGRLTLDAELLAGAVAMPAAVGWHPWFRRRRGAVRVRLDAEAVLETAGLIPTGRLVPVTGRTDLRRATALGRRRLDHAYVDARSPTSIEWPDLALEIEFQPSPTTVVVHTPSTGICIEPQTAWPNAFNLPRDTQARAGVRVLPPGETLQASMTIAWRRETDPRSALPRG